MGLIIKARQMASRVTFFARQYAGELPVVVHQPRARNWLADAFCKTARHAAAPTFEAYLHAADLLLLVPSIRAVHFWADGAGPETQTAKGGKEPRGKSGAAGVIKIVLRDSEAEIAVAQWQCPLAMTTAAEAEAVAAAASISLANWIGTAYSQTEFSHKYCSMCRQTTASAAGVTAVATADDR